MCARRANKKIVCKGMSGQNGGGGGGGVPSALLASKKGIKSACKLPRPFFFGGGGAKGHIQFLALSLIESLYCCDKCTVQTARIMLTYSLKRALTSSVTKLE